MNFIIKIFLNVLKYSNMSEVYEYILLFAGTLIQITNKIFRNFNKNWRLVIFSYFKILYIFRIYLVQTANRLRKSRDKED